MYLTRTLENAGVFAGLPKVGLVREDATSEIRRPLASAFRVDRKAHELYVCLAMSWIVPYNMAHGKNNELRRKDHAGQFDGTNKVAEGHDCTQQFSRDVSSQRCSQADTLECFSIKRTWIAAQEVRHNSRSVVII